jgi:hypothetical protein
MSYVYIFLEKYPLRIRDFSYFCKKQTVRVSISKCEFRACLFGRKNISICKIEVKVAVLRITAVPASGVKKTHEKLLFM